jgi:uncharacterized protein
MRSSKELISAIIEDNFNLVVSLVETGIDLNQIENYFALSYAVAYRRVGIIEFLLKRGAYIFDGIVDQLELKASDDIIQILSLLVDSGLNLDTNMGDNDTLLMQVSIIGEIELVKHLVKLGANVNRTNRNGESALINAGCYAKRTGNWAIYKYLEPLSNSAIRSDAEEYIKELSSFHQITPIVAELFNAVIHEDITKMFTCIKQGVDINAIGETGSTVLHIAANWGKVSIVKALIEAEADVNLVDLDDGGTPLMKAIGMLFVSKSVFVMNPVEMESNLLKTIAILIQAGADVNIKTTDGWNALASAANAGSLEVVELLLEHGAEVDAKDSYGDTALSRAKQNYTKGVSLGNPALNQSIKIEYSKIIQVLLAAGAIEEV